MEPVYTTKLTVSFAIDLEVEYNSFGGKTVDKIAEALQDDLHDLLFELPHVEGVCTTLTNLGFNDWRPCNKAQYRWRIWYALA